MTMQKKLLCYTIAGIVFTSILGTLAHFIYEWSNENFLVGLFTPVSESTWEHMKLLFFPMLLYGVFICYPGAFLHLFWNPGHNLHAD